MILYELMRDRLRITISYIDVDIVDVEGIDLSETWHIDNCWYICLYTYMWFTLLLWFVFEIIARFM